MFTHKISEVIGWQIGTQDFTKSLGNVPSIINVASGLSVSLNNRKVVVGFLMIEPAKEVCDNLEGVVTHTYSFPYFTG